MKQYIVFTLFVGSLLLGACSRRAAVGAEQNEELYIGISKIIAHPALDAIEQNIVEVVKNKGIKANFNLQNANGEVAAATSIAQLFQNEKVDLAIGIATQTAQALVQNLSGIPIFYSAITDPEGAGLLSKISSGMEIAGYSDLTPVDDHIAIIKRIQPDIQIIGQVFSSDEDNARVLNEMTLKAVNDNALRLISVAVTNTAEVRDASLSIIDQVDAFYIIMDNKVISALAALGEVADRYDIPLYTADPSSAMGNKVTVAMGFDYVSMGMATGNLIVRYLNGDNNVFDKPINYLAPEYQTFVINQEQVDKLGLSIPEDIAKLAK